MCCCITGMIDALYYLKLRSYAFRYSVDRNFDSTYPSNMVVDHKGNVDWIPPGIVRISCNIDITWYFLT